MHIAAVLTHFDVSQRHFFRQSSLAAGIDDIALANLILQQDEESVEVVFNQALRAKANCDADHTSRSEYRCDRNTKLMQNFDDGNDADDDGGDVAEDATYGVDALDFFSIFNRSRFQMHFELDNEFATELH